MDLDKAIRLTRKTLFGCGLYSISCPIKRVLGWFGGASNRCTAAHPPISNAKIKYHGINRVLGYNEIARRIFK